MFTTKIEAEKSARTPLVVIYHHTSPPFGLTSGIAPPRHTQACAQVKFARAWVQIMRKAKVKDQQSFTHEE